MSCTEPAADGEFRDRLERQQAKVSDQLEGRRRAVEANPSDLNRRADLATLYFRLGDKENATQAFDRVLRSFPELKSQANPYLEALQ